ncbi:MAG: EamA family transporter [Nocardioides sp.]|nr:EamA family transporter [Nocardioides sp.]
MTASWGSTFFLIRDLLERVPTLDFLAVRFLVAAASVLLVAPRAVARLSPESRRHAVMLGGVYGVAQVLQTAGLAHTPASVSGFITGMYVVLTPLLAAVLLRTRIGGLTWVAVAIAAGGLAVLTLDGVSMGYGEAITLMSAVLYALHIVGLGAWSDPRQALGMSIVQIIVIAVLCSIATIPDGVVLPSTGGDWASVVYMALVAGAAAMLAQTWAQAHLPPTRSAIIMSMEPVFAATFAVWLGGEPTTLRMVGGGFMVLTAMLLVELAPRRKVEGQGVSRDSMACCAPPCGHLAALSSVVDAGASPPYLRLARHSAGRRSRRPRVASHPLGPTPGRVTGHTHPPVTFGPWSS